MPGKALCAEEREEIRAGIERDEYFADIARRLGRPASTICREVERNGGRDRYCATRAERRAEQCRKRPKRTVFERDHALARRVERQLAAKDSPMTIGLGEGISHETIYQGVYANGHRGLAAGLGVHLHRRRRRRKRRVHGGQAAKASPLGAFKPISTRPDEAAERELVGHFEGDLIIGQGGRSAVVTVIDRATTYAMLGELRLDHGADAVADRLERLFRRIPLDVRLTLTWDQGREMARWAEVEEAVGIDIYFADPHSPWQRPVNEAYNGLVRRWLPKGTDLSIHSQKELDAIARRVNTMPRRSLGWDSALDHWYDALALH
jgi:IS30 family transposase